MKKSVVSFLILICNLNILAQDSDNNANSGIVYGKTHAFSVTAATVGS